MAALWLEHEMLADIDQKAPLYPSVLLTKEGLAQALPTSLQACAILNFHLLFGGAQNGKP
jgi:hypothetical protein